MKHYIIYDLYVLLSIIIKVFSSITVQVYFTRCSVGQL
jgi:hypothetical protein